jgi:hypothetical protein
MQGDFPIARPLAVLEEIDTLPGAQGKLTIINETHRFIANGFGVRCRLSLHRRQASVV